MALLVPTLPGNSTPRIEVPVLRGRGRPRIYHGNTLPVNFRVPEIWRVEGSKKAKQGNVNLTKLFAIYYKQFLDKPIEETQAFIEAWEQENGSLSEVYP
jgi:hypothetical protein